MANNLAPINIKISKDYDSEFCGSIPLHLVNLIQPHGILLVLEKDRLQIIQASENVEEFLAVPAADLLEKNLADFIPADQYEELQSKIAGQEGHDRIPLLLSITINSKKQQFTAIIHPKEEYVLVELERMAATAEAIFIRLYQQTKYITSLLKQARTTEDTAQIAATEIKKISGFDRVLIYQFDPKWNGIVIAQAKEDDMDDFMGLRFPASDVPKQARDLYFKNPYRLIPTNNYTPVRILPILNPITQRFTDLSDCNLRSVAVVHLEYLQNMGVEASMSLPIIIDNKLWGLISFHHRTHKNPGQELCSALELLSDIISAQIAARERERFISQKAQLREVHAKLLEQLYSSSGLVEGVLNGKTMLSDLLGLGGAAVLYEGGIWTAGTTPTQQQIKELVSWLRRNKGNESYSTDTLVEEYGRGSEFTASASGLIAIPINAEQGEFILGFRPEVQQTLNWGGNPDKAIQMEDDGKTYHPRNSFAIYKQTVRQTSVPWQEAEIEAAENLRIAVVEKVMKEKY